MNFSSIHYSVTAWDGISDNRGHALARVSLLCLGGVAMRHGAELGELRDLVLFLLLSNVTLLGHPALLVL